MIENPQHFSSSNESLLSKHKWWKLNIRTNAFGFHLCYANVIELMIEWVVQKHHRMSHLLLTMYHDTSKYFTLGSDSYWQLIYLFEALFCFQAKELCSSSLSLINWRHILKPKYKISTAPMIERPERSPMVPPIADNMSTNLAASSLVILSNVVTSK